MLLTARLLNDVQSINSFGYTKTLEWSQGDLRDFYIQLADASAVVPDAYPRGLRYCPAAGAGLTVSFKDVEGMANIALVCSQPFAGDASIWLVPYSTLTSLQVAELLGTYGLKLTLAEGSVITNGFVAQAISIASTSPEF